MTNYSRQLLTKVGLVSKVNDTATTTFPRVIVGAMNFHV